MNKVLLGATALVSVLAVPAAAFAQTYAYVNTSGEVMTTDAADANTAIATAPNIALHSGVMIVDSSDDSAVVGDKVTGI